MHGSCILISCSTKSAVYGTDGQLQLLVYCDSLARSWHIGGGEKDYSERHVSVLLCNDTALFTHMQFHLASCCSSCFYKLREQSQAPNGTVMSRTHVMHRSATSDIECIAGSALLAAERVAKPHYLSSHWFVLARQLLHAYLPLFAMSQPQSPQSEIAKVYSICLWSLVFNNVSLPACSTRADRTSMLSYDSKAPKVAFVPGVRTPGIINLLPKLLCKFAQRELLRVGGHTTSRGSRDLQTQDL